MISDVLSAAVSDIQEYQRDLPHVYSDLSREIQIVVEFMAAMRAFLDLSLAPDEFSEPHRAARVAHSRGCADRCQASRGNGHTDRRCEAGPRRQAVRHRDTRGLAVLIRRRERNTRTSFTTA